MDKESIDCLVRILNEACELDPVAMYTLRCISVGVNDALADHPSIEVGYPPVSQTQPVLRLVGLLNGAVGATGKYRLCEVYDDEKGFLGFRAVENKPADEA